MPPRRSQRPKRPSSQASEALTSSLPRRARRQNPVADGNATSTSTARQDPLMPEVLVSTSSATPASSLLFLSTLVLDHVVSRVTEGSYQYVVAIACKFRLLDSAGAEFQLCTSCRSTTPLQLLRLQYQCSPVSRSPLRTWLFRYKM